MVMTPDQAIRDLALKNEFARRRALNNIPDGFLTPNWLDLAIAKDWTLVRGRPSEVRARAEAEARELLTDAELQRLSRGQRAFVGRRAAA